MQRRWLVVLGLAVGGTGACLPAFPKGGSSRPRLKRAVVVDRVAHNGCYEVCQGSGYAYCQVVNLPGNAVGGRDRRGSVCFYDR